MPAVLGRGRSSARSLALLVPIPWLAKGLQYVVLGSDDEHTAYRITYNTTHTVYTYLQWLDLLFVVLVVPSILAMAPRLAPRRSTSGDRGDGRHGRWVPDGPAAQHER
ncbi:hypothetical protein [uncultured Friedmanniella sp.]|uniref:hypothetical protein n=1 Tax=uncultured Friedmanniella sp. TaxID=335381 RepID=UPI0035C9A507